MSRPLTAAMVAAITAAVVRPVIFYQATLADNSIVRYFSGLGTIVWNTFTWTGSGQVISMSEVSESDDVKTEDVTIEINGVPLANISMVEQSLANGKAGTIYIGAIDDAGAVVASPKIVFKGGLNGAQTDESDVEKPKCSIVYVDDLADLRRARVRRFTHEDQQIYYPGDRGLEAMAVSQDREFEFGKRAA